MELKGISVSEGFAQGKIKFFQRENIATNEHFEGIDQELQKLDQAITKSKEQIENLVASLKKENKQDEAEIFNAHILMLEDPEILSQVKNKITENKTSAATAWKHTLNEFIDLFKNLSDDYLRQRATDLQDIQQRVLMNLSGSNIDFSFSEDVIL